MKNKMKKEWIPLMSWIGIISIMILLTVTSGNFTMKNSGITLIILIVMAGFVLKGQISGLNPFCKMTNAIGNVNATIERMRNENEGLLWEQIRKEQTLFENKKLDSMFATYKYEMDRLYREHEEHIHCDIADYINEDNVGEAVHVHFLEQLPGIMTGLGILGTFIGLAIGLSNFNNDGVDQMISSIAPLIDGIKVAFYTSIYGVILSLAFNVYYKYCQGKFNKNLEAFYSLFYKYVTHVPANDMANQLLHYQQSQALAMEQFTETISVQFAKSFEQFAAPTFQQIGDTMTDLSRNMNQTLDTLSNEISNKQKESMGEIVDNFITQMNLSLGGTFEQLKNTIDELCEGQKTTAEDVNILIQNLGSTIHEIDRVHEVSTGIVKNLDEYCMKLNSYQTDVNEAYTHVQQQEAMFADITSQQQECINALSNHEAALVSNITEIGERTKQIHVVFKSHTEMLNQCTENNKQVIEEMVDSLDKSSINLAEISDGLGNNLKGMAEKTFGQLNGTLEKLQHVNEMSENTIRRMEEYCTTLNSYQEGINKAYEHVQEQEAMFAGIASKQEACMEALSNHEATLVSNIGEFGEKTEHVSDVFQNHAEMLNKNTEQQMYTLEQMIHSFDKSSGNLSDVAGGFHDNLKGAIDRTFEQFDTNLSDIAICLSGTIAEINETTQNIPKALRGSFVTMQKQLEEYIVTIDQLRQISQDSIDRMKDTEDETQKEMVVVTEHEA